MIRCICLVMLIALLAATAHGQMVEDYRFLGKVVDQAGKPLAFVEITLRDAESGTRISFKSDSDGQFDRRMIPHAKYQATFEKKGYATRTEAFDWSVSPESVETVEVKVVMQSDADAAKKVLGKKAATLYDESYAALEQNDCVTATRKANELLKAGAGDYEYAVHFILARCHANQRQFPQAVSEYRRVLALKPDFFEARFDLATVLETQGEHDAALREYAQADSLQSGNIDVQYNMGAILLQQKKFELARPHLQKATEIDSTHAMAHKALGFAYLQGNGKDMRAAREHLERYLALNPDAPDAAEIRSMVAELKSSTQ